MGNIILLFQMTVRNTRRVIAELISLSKVYLRIMQIY